MFDFREVRHETFQTLSFNLSLLYILLSHFGLNIFPLHLFHLNVLVFIVDQRGDEVLLTPVGLNKINFHLHENTGTAKHVSKQ